MLLQEIVEVLDRYLADGIAKVLLDIVRQVFCNTLFADNHDALIDGILPTVYDSRVAIVLGNQCACCGNGHTHRLAGSRHAANPIHIIEDIERLRVSHGVQYLLAVLAKTHRIRCYLVVLGYKRFHLRDGETHGVKALFQLRRAVFRSKHLTCLVDNRFLE